MKNEMNLSDTYRAAIIKTLTTLSKYFENKLFSEITHEELLCHS